MFERYNEKARRTIFFARYEASQFGSPQIEAEFLLLGLLREDRALSMRFITPRTSAEALRNEIQRNQTVRESISTSVDLPLSNECKHILAYAAEESERLRHQHIGTEHLLLGILREQNCFASELLRQHGIDASVIRREIAETQLADTSPRTSRTISGLESFEPVLKVANLEVSIAFYAKLGFIQISNRGPGTAVLKRGAWILVLDQNLAVNQLLSFRSSNILPIVLGLQSGGIQLEQPLRTKADGSETALLRDPDGNIISLFSPSRSGPPSTPN